jgi:hypothetical protein
MPLALRDCFDQGGKSDFRAIMVGLVRFFKRPVHFRTARKRRTATNLIAATAG